MAASRGLHLLCPACFAREIRLRCVIVAIFMVDGKSLMIAVASASLEEGAKRE